MAETARILIVDDNAMSRELARDILADAGHDVADAATADQALAALEAFRPGVVLLDWHLKGATGGDVLARIRGPGAGRDVRVLVVTADIRPELRAAALAAGADALVTKPYRASTLLAAVAALADGTRKEAR